MEAAIGPPSCRTAAGPVALKTIDLLANYNPVTGAVTGPIGGLPIQTPVSPHGRWVITANTLTATITIIDTATDELVKMLPCSAGCHGVNFGVATQAMPQSSAGSSSWTVRARWLTPEQQQALP